MEMMEIWPTANIVEAIVELQALVLRDRKNVESLKMVLRP
jgi:hypothetical protein